MRKIVNRLPMATDPPRTWKKTEEVRHEFPPEGGIKRIIVLPLVIKLPDIAPALGGTNAWTDDQQCLIERFALGTLHDCMAESLEERQHHADIDAAFENEPAFSSATQETIVLARKAVLALEQMIVGQFFEEDARRDV